MIRLKKIFEPVQIGSLELPNRIFMSPMVMHYAADNGSVTQKMIDHYVARAKGGPGMIILETTYVDLKSLENHMSGLYDDKMIPGFKKLTDAVHAAGGKIAIQLNHKGRISLSSMTFQRTVSASAIPEYGETPRALPTAEVAEVIDAYGEAVRRAKDAGFDAVELHMAHGYLINQFLSPYSNFRTDEYGGSPEKRAKFAVDILKNARKKVGNDFPIIAKINSTEHVKGGIVPEDWKLWLPMMEKAGLNAVTISGGISETTFYMTAPMSIPRAFNVERARQIRQYASIPVGVVGRIPEVPLAEEILESGAADFIVMGRSFLADPDFVNKAKEGRLEDIRPCLSCNQGCMQRVDNDADAACLTNPLHGRYGDPWAQIRQTGNPKKVYVVGGGPAGMMAAATAARCGHQVTLFEKEEKLGGNFSLAGIPPLKKEINRFIPFMEHDLQQSGVNVLKNHKVTEKDLREGKPDAVILASGSEPFILPVPGAEFCVTASDVLSGKKKIEGSCVVIGGGSVGCETADFLNEQGAQVTIIEMTDKLCAELEKRSRIMQLKKLIHAGTNMLIKAKVLRIGEDFVEYESLGLVQRIYDIQHVVMAVGYKANKEEELCHACEDMGIEYYAVGDCVKARNALCATREAYDCALRL